MKRYLLAFLLACCCAFSLHAGDLQEAEQYYREGRFAAALGAYENLLKNYPNDPHLYYNIGNCYFKMGSRGLAIANYYRAFRLAPRDTDIRHNLTLSLEAAGERFVPAGMPVILHKAFFSLTILELKGLTILSLLLFCVLAGFWLCKRKAGWLVCISLAVLLLMSGWYFCRNHADAVSLAVVAAPTAELRSGPGNNFPASANVAQGHLLVVLDSKDHWDEVIIKSQAIKGWIAANDLEKI